MKDKLKRTVKVIFGGDGVPVGKAGFWTKTIPEGARKIHSFTCGASGVGKSHHLLFRLNQAIDRGEGVGLIDPKGDLYLELLKSIYEKEKKGANLKNKLVLFDPTAKRVPAFNPIEVKSNDPERRYQTALSVMKVFKEIWGESFYGPRLADILRHSLLLLIEHGETLTMIPRLLTDKDYRNFLLKGLKNRQVKEFFEYRYNPLRKQIRHEWSESTLNKVQEFCASPTIRKIIGQRKSSIDFRNIIDNGKIFLANLPKGKLGDNSYLLGALLVSRINQAAIARCNQPMTSRRLFMFFLDEFDNFAVKENMREVLSESRSSGLSLQMATQDLAGINEDLVASIFANAKLLFSFRVSRADAEVLAKHMFQNEGEEVKFQLKENFLGDPETNPIYRSITEEAERRTNELVNLKKRQVYLKIRGSGEEPTLLRTIDTPGYKVSQKTLRNFANKAMKPYTLEKNEIEKKLEDHLNQVDKKVDQALLNGKI